MKKILSLLLAAAMVFCMTAGAFADNETDADGCLAVSLENFDEELYDGVWAVFYDLFAMYLPADWNTITLEEEDYADGIILCICSNEEGSDAMMITCVYTPDEVTVSGLDDVMAIKSQECECRKINVNGLHVVLAEDDETGYSSILFVSNDNYVFEIGFMDTDNDAYMPYYLNMLYSLLTDSDALEYIKTEAYVDISPAIG